MPSLFSPFILADVRQTASVTRFRSRDAPPCRTLARVKPPRPLGLFQRARCLHDSGCRHVERSIELHTTLAEAASILPGQH
jgi:hypothetical protein